jgi:hypothetical protein
MAQLIQRKEMRDAYDAILKLYDCAEDIVTAIELVGGQEMEAALNAAEPVIEQLESTAEILSETFIIFGETGQKLDAHNKKRAESSIRKLYVALGNFCESISEVLLGKITAISGDIRSLIIAVQQKAKRKFGERVERLFNIMLWIGDYMKKLATQLEKVGCGLIAELAIPQNMQLQAVTASGRKGLQRNAESQHGWSL